MADNDKQRRSLKIVREDFQQFIRSARFHSAGFYDKVIDPNSGSCYPLPVGMSIGCDFMTHIDPIEVAKLAQKMDFDIAKDAERCGCA